MSAANSENNVHRNSSQEDSPHESRSESLGPPNRKLFGSERIQEFKSIEKEIEFLSEKLEMEAGLSNIAFSCKDNIAEELEELDTMIAEARSLYAEGALAISDELENVRNKKMEMRSLVPSESHALCCNIKDIKVDLPLAHYSSGNGTDTSSNNILSWEYDLMRSDFESGIEYGVGSSEEHSKRFETNDKSDIVEENKRVIFTLDTFLASQDGRLRELDEMVHECHKIAECIRDCARLGELKQNECSNMEERRTSRNIHIGEKELRPKSSDLHTMLCDAAASLSNSEPPSQGSRPGERDIHGMDARSQNAEEDISPPTDESEETQKVEISGGSSSCRAVSPTLQRLSCGPNGEREDTPNKESKGIEENVVEQSKRGKERRSAWNAERKKSKLVRPTRSDAAGTNWKKEGSSGRTQGLRDPRGESPGSREGAMARLGQSVQKAARNIRLSIGLPRLISNRLWTNNSNLRSPRVRSEVSGSTRSRISSILSCTWTRGRRDE